MTKINYLFSHIIAILIYVLHINEIMMLRRPFRIDRL